MARFCTILVQIVGFGRLQAARMILESRVVDNMAEGFLPNLPLPDVLVPVHPRAEVGLGVVQVESENLLQSNQ